MNENRFSVRMTPLEAVVGACYLPFYLIFFSMLIQLVLFWILPEAPTDGLLNACYYGLNTVCVGLIFHRFLWKNFTIFTSRWKSVLKTIPAALGIYYLISMAVNLTVILLMPDFVNQNNETVVGILDQQPVVMIVIAVVLAPFIEETLFRGLIFSNLQATNRLLAYGFTALFFAAIHIVPYLRTMAPMEVVLSVVQYLPATLVLARLYEKTDTILAPMLLHAAINAVSCLMMGLL